VRRDAVRQPREPGALAGHGAADAVIADPHIHLLPPYTDIQGDPASARVLRGVGDSFGGHE